MKQKISEAILQSNVGLDIGVTIPYRDSSFMDSIMESGIADSGMDSTGDVFFEDVSHNQEIMSDDEFDRLMEEWGIESKCFRK